MHAVEPGKRGHSLDWKKCPRFSGVLCSQVSCSLWACSMPFSTDLSTEYHTIALPRIPSADSKPRDYKQYCVNGQTSALWHLDADNVHFKHRCVQSVSI